MGTTQKISIITPYYNAEAWIGRCADSLRTQEGPFEFIFVNDSSTDDSEKVLEDHTDDRFILLENEYAKGVSGARNTGLKYAAGDYISFLDADDELMPGAYGLFENLLRTDADIHQANHVRHYVKKGTTLQMYENAAGDYPLTNLPLAWFGVWNKLYKADLLEEIRFDESMSYGEDEIFNLECLLRARHIHHGSEITVKHNIENKQSLSHIRTDADLLLQLRKLIDFMAAHKDPEMRALVYNLTNTHLASKWYWSAIVEKEAKRG